jgi:hypothetical protein
MLKKGRLKYSSGHAKFTPAKKLYAGGLNGTTLAAGRAVSSVSATSSRRATSFSVARASAGSGGNSLAM